MNVGEPGGKEEVQRGWLADLAWADIGTSCLTRPLTPASNIIF